MAVVINSPNSIEGAIYTKVRAYLTNTILFPQVKIDDFCIPVEDPWTTFSARLFTSPVLKASLWYVYINDYIEILVAC